MAGDKVLFVLAPIFLCPLMSRALSGDRKFATVHAQQAPWQPPGWVFGVVWPVLYGLLGYSLWVTVDNHLENGKWGMLALFALNVCWPPVFLRGYVTGALGLLLVMIAQAAWVADQTPLVTPLLGSVHFVVGVCSDAQRVLCAAGARGRACFRHGEGGAHGSTPSMSSEIIVLFHDPSPQLTEGPLQNSVRCAWVDCTSDAQPPPCIAKVRA